MISIGDIQSALQERQLDGWLFVDFRGSDPLAYSILNLPADLFHSRRWAYFVPAEGVPTRIVHAIEAGALDSLPGTKNIYLAWREWHQRLADAVAGSKRVAMQYSPMNAIPYVSRVDAGTVELVRSFGVEVASSADLVQQFEAVLSDTQYASHIYAADSIARICQEGFDEIGRRLSDDRPATEYEIQQFLVRRFEEEGLTTDHPPIVAVNAHSADPHFAPASSGSSRIERHQSVLIDLWAKRREPGSIYADITRVAYTGPQIPVSTRPFLRLFAMRATRPFISLNKRGKSGLDDGGERGRCLPIGDRKGRFRSVLHPSYGSFDSSINAR